MQVRDDSHVTSKLMSSMEAIKVVEVWGKYHCLVRMVRNTPMGPKANGG